MGKKRIVFMGTPEIAVNYLQALVENNFSIVAVYTQPPRKKGRGLKLNKSPIHIFAENFGIPTYDSTNFQLSEIIEKFKNLKPDLVVVMGYGVIIPKLILKIPKYGFINIHVSLLPRWRGAAPIEHAILNGDNKTGISIFQIEEKLDTGPILDFKEVEIKKNYNKAELSSELNINGTKLLIDLLPRLFKSNVKEIKQDSSQATYAKKITPELRKINFNQDVNSVYNHIRAFAPRPSAWFILNNSRISIIACSKEICKTNASSIINDKFHIGCTDGKIIPKIIQREGKKPMEIKEFLRGFKFKINQKVND